jgi:hypothetical protein
MTTYTLSITKLETENYSSFSNVVIQVSWDYTGTDENGVSGTCPGRSRITADTIDPATFIPYDQLSEETIKGWVETSLDNQTSLYYRSFVEAQVADKIAQKVKDLQEQPELPWGSPVPPVPWITPPDGPIGPI